MDTLAFIASLAQSLGWPLAVVLIALMLRKSVVNLMPGLQRLKLKNVELEFGRQLEAVRKELGPETSVVSAAQALPEPKGTAGYYRSLAEVSPRAAILEAWLGFEVAANQAYDAITPSPRRRVSMQQLFEELGKAQLLTAMEIEALTVLRGLRNKVVHGPEPDLSPEMTAQYAVLLQRISDDLQAKINQRFGAS